MTHASEQIPTNMAPSREGALAPAPPQQDDQVVIDVKNVSMAFNMANQALGSFKEYAIALARRELMFKEFRALNNVSFQVKKGDVYGILGTNGSGKSTLLKIISGVLSPTEGSVEVTGKIVPLIEMTAGFDIELTGRENIYLNGSLLGYSREYIDAHFDDIVNFAEIDGFLDIPLKSYSSGMVSRIAFAIATVMVPDILIVDEVLAVGDFMFQEKCEERIQSLIHDYGVTVLIVSHSIAQIERLCNKAIWIEKSRPRMMGPALEVAEAYKSLGGHEGSPEAEREVMALLHADIPAEAIDAVTTETISSPQWYETAADIIDACTFENTDDVVLATGDSVFDRIVALGVGGALKAPVLFIHDRGIDKRVEKSLAALRPKRCIVLSTAGRGKGVSKGVLRQLKGVVGAGGAGATGVVHIAAATPQSLAARAAEYLKEQGTNCQLMKASVSQETDLVTLSSVIYKHGLVVSVFEPEELAINDSPTAELSMLLSIEDSRIQSFCGSMSEYSDAMGELLWLDGGSDGEGSPGSECVDFVLATIPDPSDTLSAAPLIAQKSANLLQISRGNLDGVARAAEFIQNYPKPINTLTFIGGTCCFNEVDKEALRRAAALNRQNFGADYAPSTAQDAPSNLQAN